MAWPLTVAALAGRVVFCASAALLAHKVLVTNVA
jgi:hypothetical protein